MSIIDKITMTIELSEPIITEHSPGVYAFAFTMKHPKGETAFTILVDDEGVPVNDVSPMYAGAVQAQGVRK